MHDSEFTKETGGQWQSFTNAVKSDRIQRINRLNKSEEQTTKSILKTSNNLLKTNGIVPDDRWITNTYSHLTVMIKHMQ